MSRWIFVVCTTLLTACASGTNPAPLPASDTGTDTGPVDTGPPPCTQNGAAACNAHLTALCERFAQCCTAGGSCAAGTCTDGGFCTAAGCKSAFLTAKADSGKGLPIDCGASKWSSKTVCADVTKKCTDDLPLLACSDLVGGSWNNPASCVAMLAQF